MSCNKKPKLLVIADENIEQIDILTRRIMFCFAEISLNNEAKKLLRQIDNFGRTWEASNYGRKFHLADLNKPEDINHIINLITRLRPTVKLFIEYTISSDITQSKANLLQKSITTLRNNNYRYDSVKWLIENSDEYANLIRADVLTANKHMTIVADVFCNIFARKLSDGLNTEDLSELHRRLKPLVRLEYIITQSETLTRNGIDVI